MNAVGKCICDSYVSYGSTQKGIRAPMMAADECVNCAAIRSKLQSLALSGCQYTRDGLYELFAPELNISSELDKLKSISDCSDAALFLYVFHEIKLNVRDASSLEDVAAKIVAKRKDFFAKVAEYLD